jgi:hypothetical protein
VSIVLSNQVSDLTDIGQPGDYVGPRATEAYENGILTDTTVTELFYMPAVGLPIVRITAPPWMITENGDGTITLTQFIDN